MQVIDTLSQATISLSWFAGTAQHLAGDAANELLSVSAGLEALELPSGWQNKIFQKPIWSGLMFAVRVSLCLLGVLGLIYEVRARRMGMPVRERTKKRLALLFTVLSIGAYFDFGNANVRYSEYYHRHEFYHYYLGSKYFSELGYSRLYDCTLVAEIDNGRRSQVENR